VSLIFYWKCLAFVSRPLPILKMEAQKASTVLGKKEIGVLQILLLFTVVMLFLPITSYFIMKAYLFEGILGYENGAFHSAIGTVVIIHIIIGWYIWLAVKDESAEQRPVKAD